MPKLYQPYQPAAPQTWRQIAHQVLAVAAYLEHQGCQVVAAHAISGTEPAIEIRPPADPARLFDAWASTTQRAGRQVAITRSFARLHGVRVEWAPAGQGRARA